LLNSDDRGLITHDPLVLNIDQGVGGPKINGKIVGKNAKEGIQHHKTPSNLREKGLSREKITDLAFPGKVMKKQRKNADPEVRQWLQPLGPFPILQR
jgi:hypothetical protein